MSTVRVKGVLKTVHQPVATTSRRERNEFANSPMEGRVHMKQIEMITRWRRLRENHLTPRTVIAVPPGSGNGAC